MIILLYHCEPHFHFDFLVNCTYTGFRYCIVFRLMFFRINYNRTNNNKTIYTTLQKANPFCSQYDNMRKTTIYAVIVHTLSFLDWRSDKSEKYLYILCIIKYFEINRATAIRRRKENILAQKRR